MDLDDDEWRADALAVAQSCDELDIPAAVEISRSGNGAHVWIFFADRVPAIEARRLGTAIVSYTCARTRQLTLRSYDRLFPNQDRMPSGGFGNLIALPLQKRPRESGCSVFVDRALRPFSDQWSFLAGVRQMAPANIAPTIQRAVGIRDPLDIAFIADEDLAAPWRAPTAPTAEPQADWPASVSITLSNHVYIEKAGVPQSLANQLIRLAAFQNPEFYKAQALRLSVWNTPRVIGCAENFPRHFALPRGCFDAVTRLLKASGIDCEVHDERHPGEILDVTFAGALRDEQQTAVEAMLRSDTGVLSAPPAFGKTVIAAAMIARRRVNTLVLVHRSDLRTQWQERLQAFLGVDARVIGTIGGGVPRPTGQIDIAVMQSLSRHGSVDPVVEAYGQIIVDECHHIGAISFDAILKRAKARFVLGLTATPVRRDGQHPIIFMHCGPIRHTIARSRERPSTLIVERHPYTTSIDVPVGAAIQDVYRHLVDDHIRTRCVAETIIRQFRTGRKTLVLTERTEHIARLLAALAEHVPPPFVLHGRLGRSQRAAVIAQLDALPPDTPHIVIATGRLVGEGFDHPPLDTLVLTMPVSWKGTLQQYAGRLLRPRASKGDVRIIDIVDTVHPALLRMWQKRVRGYTAMGYRIVDSVAPDTIAPDLWAASVGGASSLADSVRT
jgi:superfamily II DNA or RNA helicase